MSNTPLPAYPIQLHCRILLPVSCEQALKETFHFSNVRLVNSSDDVRVIIKDYVITCDIRSEHELLANFLTLVESKRAARSLAETIYTMMQNSPSPLLSTIDEVEKAISFTHHGDDPAETFASIGAELCNWGAANMDEIREKIEDISRLEKICIELFSKYEVTNAHLNETRSNFEKAKQLADELDIDRQRIKGHAKSQAQELAKANEKIEAYKEQIDAYEDEIRKLRVSSFEELKGVHAKYTKEIVDMHNAFAKLNTTHKAKEKALKETIEQLRSDIVLQKRKE